MRPMQTLLEMLCKGIKLRPKHAGELISRSAKEAQTALAALARRGLATSVAGTYACTPYGLIFMEGGGEISCGPSGPNRKTRVFEGTVRAKAWRAMRIKGKFGLDDLGRAVLDGSEAGCEPLDNIRKYVLALLKAGYLLEMKRRTPGSAPTSNGCKRWMLVRDTGPKAPIARQNGEVWDQNESRVYPREAL